MLRFFYFAFACLLYSLWRLIDHLVQVCITDTFTDDPWMANSDNNLPSQNHRKSDSGQGIYNLFPTFVS